MGMFWNVVENVVGSVIFYVKIIFIFYAVAVPLARPKGTKMLQGGQTPL